eukprot:scaffold952_cov409-Prasinococcus_capsulatus_cf.AAC.62
MLQCDPTYKIEKPEPKCVVAEENLSAIPSLNTAFDIALGISPSDYPGLQRLFSVDSATYVAPQAPAPVDTGTPQNQTDSDLPTCGDDMNGSLAEADSDCATIQAAAPDGDTDLSTISELFPPQYLAFFLCCETYGRCDELADLGQCVLAPELPTCGDDMNGSLAEADSDCATIQAAAPDGDTDLSTISELFPPQYLAFFLCCETYGRCDELADLGQCVLAPELPTCGDDMNGSLAEADSDCATIQAAAPDGDTDLSTISELFPPQYLAFFLCCETYGRCDELADLGQCVLAPELPTCGDDMNGSLAEADSDCATIQAVAPDGDTDLSTISELFPPQYLAFFLCCETYGRCDELADLGQCAYDPSVGNETLPSAFDSTVCASDCGRQLVGNPCTCTDSCQWWYGECSSQAVNDQARIETEEVTKEEAERILQNYEQYWLDNIDRFVSSLLYIDVSYAASRSVEDVISDASRGQWPLVVAGYALMFVFVLLYFLVDLNTRRINRFPPSPLICIGVLCVIVVCTFGSFGVAGLLSMGPLKMNAISMQVLPFLVLGLSINDWFVLCASFRKALDHYRGRYWDPQIVDKIMGMTMAHGGSSITLSSLANALAFFLGSITPIPAVRSFAVAVGISVILDYLLSVLAYPSLLTLELRRFVKKGVTDFAACFGDIEVAPGKESEGQRVPAFWTYTNHLLTRGGIALALAANIGLLSGCIYCVNQVELGLKLSDAVPSNNYLYDFAKNSEEYFHSTPIWITARDLNFANETAALNELNYRFVTEGVYTDKNYEVTSMLNYYSDFVDAKFCSYEICSHEVYIYYDGWKARQDLCDNIASNEECYEACVAFCPQGLAGSGTECVFSIDETNDKASCKCPGRTALKEEFFYNYFDEFYNGGIRGQLAQVLSRTNDQNELSAVRTLAYVQDANTLRKEISHVERGREILDALPISNGGKNVFAFDYLVYAINEQYLALESHTVFILGMGVLAAFFAMLFLIMHPWADLIVTAVLVVNLVELYGFVYILNLKLNAVTLINLMTAVGINVEFLTHIGRSFMLVSGDKAHRVASAMAQLGPAVLCGGVSTFLGIFCLAFSYYKYFVNYFFAMYDTAQTTQDVQCPCVGIVRSQI